MIHPPEWYERQYNNRANIPESPQILQDWALWSTQARGRMTGTLDVPYGGGEAESLDIFGPSDPRGALRPVLFYVHGGYWRALSKSDQSFIAEPFTQAGAVVVLPDYALAPRVSVEHISLQMVRAVAWVWRHIHNFGGDRRRIVVAGHSAGGQLVGMLLACRWRTFDRQLPQDLVTRGLSLSGLFDMEPLRHVPFLAPDLALSEASALRLSPAFMPPPAGRRLVALVGELESEEFQRQNRLIRERWGAERVPVCETVPGCNHMTVLRPLAMPQQRTHQQALELLGLRPL